jgi:uncharacterized protein YukE
LLTDASRRPRLVLVATLIAAVIGGGCGGGSEDDYRDGLVNADKEFGQELRDVVAKMQAAARAKSQADYQKAVDQLDRAADDFKKELGELDTPDGADDEEARVNESVDRFTDSVGLIAAAVQSRDTEAIRAEQARVKARADEVARSVQQLKEAVE